MKKLFYVIKRFKAGYELKEYKVGSTIELTEVQANDLKAREYVCTKEEFEAFKADNKEAVKSYNDKISKGKKVTKVDPITKKGAIEKK
jgi:hypothetical protein